eukprot:scaffold64749_cov28-Tisochrysis_lutea.AAC.1
MEQLSLRRGKRAGDEGRERFTARRAPRPETCYKEGGESRWYQWTLRTGKARQPMMRAARPKIVADRNPALHRWSGTTAPSSLLTSLASRGSRSSCRSGTGMRVPNCSRLTSIGTLAAPRQLRSARRRHIRASRCTHATCLVTRAQLFFRPHPRCRLSRWRPAQIRWRRVHRCMEG